MNTSPHRRPRGELVGPRFENRERPREHYLRQLRKRAKQISAAAAVDESLQPLATIRVPVSRDGYRSLRRFARSWPAGLWAIEGASGVGAPLTARLAEDGVQDIDVPAKLATRVRVLSTGHGRKNDAINHNNCDTVNL